MLFWAPGRIQPQTEVPVTHKHFLLTSCGICCHSYHPSAGEISSFKTSISKCPLTFCCMGLPPGGSFFGLPLGKKNKTPKYNSGEPFCLEMEAIKLDGEAHSSHSVMRISSQWNTKSKSKLKSLIFVGFYKYSGTAEKITILKMQLLWCYFIWLKKAVF